MKLRRPSADGWNQQTGYRKQLVFSAEELSSPGALVQHVVVDAGDSVALHLHQHASEIFHVNKGTAVMHFNGEPVTLGVGDTLLCEPGDHHDVVNNGPDAIEYVVFKTNWDPDDTVWL